ncbi:MAG: hypothetical protein OXG92_14115 [Chloroflexi bacterium]|nr:hypothetical protein [Chloroflexota bacterium]
MGDKDDDWSVGVSHSIDTINVGVGMDSEDGLAIGVGTDLSGVSTFVYWSKSEFKDALFYDGSANDIFARQENTGLGVKASMSAGEGATFSVAYSTHKHEQTNAILSSDGAAAPTFNGNATTKLIEVDFSYDLGGGATLSAGIDKKDAEELEVGVPPGSLGDTRTLTTSTDTTTLEAAISFSF